MVGSGSGLNALWWGSCLSDVKSWSVKFSGANTGLATLLTLIFAGLFFLYFGLSLLSVMVYGTLFMLSTICLYSAKGSGTAILGSPLLLISEETCASGVIRPSLICSAAEAFSNAYGSISCKSSSSSLTGRYSVDSVCLAGLFSKGSFGFLE